MKRMLWLMIALLLSGIIIFLVVYYQKPIEVRRDLDDILARIVNFVYIITIIAIIFLVIRENSAPINTIAWIQVLIFLPIIGIILYVFFGINYRKRKMFNRKASKDFLELETLTQFKESVATPQKLYETNISPAQRRMSQLMYNNNKALLTYHNQAELFTDGSSTISALFEDLKQAQKNIHLEYFSIMPDEVGRQLQAILIEKAKSGVQVRLICDAVGSWRLPASFFRKLRSVGVQVYEFLPVKLPFLSSKLNYRNHRKICVIDGSIGYIGGVNLGRKYLGKHKFYRYWRDTHVRLIGDAVYSLQKVFLTDWSFITGKLDYQAEFFPPHDVENLLPVQIISSGPDSDWETIMQAYFAAISRASNYIYVATPYFMLNESMLTALKTAALSGVDVRLILPAKNDYRIIYYGSRSYYEELLRSGIRIYEYTKGFIHAKVLLTDDVFLSIGSANMDIRSFKHNFEVNCIMYDDKYAQEVKTHFYQDFNDSKEIILSEFVKRPALNKVWESIARLFSPIL